MKRLVSIIIALVILAALSFGCATVQKEAQVKCPKCGAVFTVQQGLDEYQRVHR